MIEKFVLLVCLGLVHFRENWRTLVPEWSGCFFGLLGSFLLATNTTYSRYGWIGYFIANVAMIIFARRIRAYGLLVQQLGFIGVTIFGLYRAFDRHEVWQQLQVLLI